MSCSLPKVTLAKQSGVHLAPKRSLRRPSLEAAANRRGSSGLRQTSVGHLRTNGKSLGSLARATPYILASFVTFLGALVGSFAVRAEGGWGAFVATTRIGTGVEFDSNPFGLRTNATSDRIYFVSPGLSVTSRWVRHRLSADLEVNYREFEKSDIEATDFRGQVSGVFNISRNFDVGFEVAGGSLHSLRFVDNVPTNIVFGNRDLPANLAGLIPVTQWGERVWLRYSSYRLTNTVTLTYDNVEVGNAATVGGGTADLSFRNSRNRGLLNQTDIRLSPNIQTFLSLSAIQSENPNAPDRDSTTRGVAGGFDWAVTPLLSTNLTLAYSQQDFETALTDAAPSRRLSVGVRWLPLRYLSLGLTSTISEEGVNFEQASSSGKSWSVGGDMNYGISKTLVLTTAAFYGHANRQTTASVSRTDDDYSARVALNYNFWRDAFMTLQHDWRLGKSSDTTADLEGQVTRAEVRARF